ncbi:oxygenase MpaB family protein [Reichenbachiella sp. MSK19-1]|uniref:oxygenase MpaB family protein n=1 Tax=Reichenbachiella sp. MSK19-1 TaxID=1897631 RepID=UPI000ECE3F01|nr:oxygenase MpaB family protein [Reichenbachiella sp. MSK19-1]RJE75448.1 hypothetical protein BGP76_16840 [Reichenbachiella sp. MSK19-1]
MAFDLSCLDTDSLEGFRSHTDPLADNTVREIIDSGYEAQINQIFALLVQNDSFDAHTFCDLDGDLADTLTRYFEKSSVLPEWADMQQVLIGEELFATYGPEVFMLLNVSSLPMCYTCANGAQVLFDTGRLLTHNGDVDPLARRLMETAQMVVNVLSPGGLLPDGKGLVTIQKVRLIHAAIRYFIKRRGWDTETLGEPINQEDLAGTLMSFGPVILSGLKHLNADLTPVQCNAYMHTWKVVGYLMGIDEQLLPDTYEQGFGLATKILEHQACESEAGKALNNACTLFMHEMIPMKLFDDVPAYLTEYFLADFSKASGIDLGECIGVKNEIDLRDKLVLRLTQFIVGHLSNVANIEVVQRISAPFNRLLLEGIIKYYNKGKKVHFFIPPSLKKNWKLED